MSEGDEQPRRGDRYRGSEETAMPTIDGRPVRRYALLDPDRVPLNYVEIRGVPDDVLAAWSAEQGYADETHEEFAARHGGSVERTASRAVRLAMVRHEDGSYRVVEVDGDWRPTGHETTHESLESALRWAAMAYGHPVGTLCWSELYGPDDAPRT